MYSCMVYVKNVATRLCLNPVLGSDCLIYLHTVCLHNSTCHTGVVACTHRHMVDITKHSDYTCYNAEMEQVYLQL